VANDQLAIWVVEASNATIGGTSPGARNLISGNSQWGIVIELASDNLVLGNFVGTDVTGTHDLGNTSHGVAIASSTNNTIGGTSAGARNVISGNDEDGIAFFGVSSSGNAVLGNFIGTDVSGTADLGNAWNGIELLGGSGNSIGGNTPAARNVISGNDLYNGILIATGATLNTVSGNFIGTDVSGTVALGNGLAGVRIVDAHENTIGGANVGERNIISGNLTVGVRIAQVGSHHNTVLGNFIGTDVTGTVALGNLLAGVEIEAAANNTIGGTSPGEGNVISGSPLGNRLAGVGTAAGASNNTIGGTGVTPGRCDGPCNRIGFTTLAANDGVRILAGSGNGNAILGNSIFSNAELGIDLEGTGVTPNDLGDPDVGANAVQNFPELNLAEATPAGVTVDGSLNSVPSRGFRIEFFASPACDASSHGEGSRYLGFTNVTTDASGDAFFGTVLTGPVSDGEAITATASAAGLITNTSEFSECITATCLSTAVFGHTVMAQDRNTLVWGAPAVARFVKGDLASVGSYPITSTGELPGAASLDISADSPGPRDGMYYVIRPLACGSWQTAAGAEPERDIRLP